MRTTTTGNLQSPPKVVVHSNRQTTLKRFEEKEMGIGQLGSFTSILSETEPEAGDLGIFGALGYGRPKRRKALKVKKRGKRLSAAQKKAYKRIARKRGRALKAGGPSRRRKARTGKSARRRVGGICKMRSGKCWSRSTGKVVACTKGVRRCSASTKKSKGAGRKRSATGRKRSAAGRRRDSKGRFV